MFYHNLIRLCNEHGTTPTEVCHSIGLAGSAATKWKSGAVPRDTTLKKIADYFGVTVEDLLSNEKKKALDVKPNAVFLDRNMIYEIPIFETVSAGFGAIADDNIVDYTPLYFTNPGEAAETICIKVKGDSMYPKIEDGDIIQVHRQEWADSGTIVVVLLDGEEGLVKRIEYGEGWVELHSINPYYKTMRFTGADVTRVQVVGVVRKLIKNF